MAGNPQIQEAVTDLIKRIEILWEDAPAGAFRRDFAFGEDYQGLDYERAVFRTSDETSRQYSLSFIDRQRKLHQLTFIDDRPLGQLEGLPEQGYFVVVYRTGNTLSPDIKEIDPIEALPISRELLAQGNRPEMERKRLERVLDNAKQMQYNRVEQFLQRYDSLLPKLPS